MIVLGVKREARWVVRWVESASDEMRSKSFPNQVAAHHYKAELDVRLERTVH